MSKGRRAEDKLSTRVEKEIEGKQAQGREAGDR